MYEIAVVEDEPEHQSQPRRYIQACEREHEDCFDVYVSSDELDTLDNYTADYDIIFMDIQVKHLNGMKTVQSIRETDGNAILVFITSMAQLAIQGYAVDALDYVLKPVSEFVFTQQPGEMVRKLRMRNHDTLIIIQGGNMIEFPVSQISYVENQRHDIMAHLERGVYTTRSTTKGIGSELENQHFSGCNNCFPMNLQHVEQIEQNRVIVAGEELQISGPRRKASTEALTDYMDGKRGQRVQGIPKLYTALAEWLACLVHTLLLKKRFDKYRTAGTLAAALSLLYILQYYIGVLPVTFWIPLMIVATLFIYGPILLCCRVTYTGAAFCFSLAPITTKFVASLEWQLYSSFTTRGWNSQQVRLAFLVFFFGCLFAAIHIIKKKYLSKEEHLTVSVRSAGGFLLSAIVVLLVSNVSYTYSNTPFNGTGGNEVFYIRTLVDFTGPILLITQQDRLREIQLERELAVANTVLPRQYEQYQQSKEDIGLVNQKYHDLKHRIVAIRAEQNEEKRNTHLEEMEPGTHMYEARNKTGSSVLDTILAGKDIYCVQHNINFTCVADGSLIDFINTMDICTIFGDALDNVIESVEKIEDAGRRIVKTVVFVQNRFLTIRFENYFESKINTKGSFPVTMEKNQKYCNFGLKNIRKITEKYGGTITVRTKDQWFTLRILVPMAGKQ